MPVARLCLHSSMAHPVRAILDTVRKQAVRVSATVVTCVALSLPTVAEMPAQAPGTVLFDETGLVSKGMTPLIEKAGAAILRDDDVRVRFAFVKTVPFGETVGEYARELAGEWGLGEREVLFVASPKLARAGVWVGGAVSSVLGEERAVSVAEETFGVKAGEEQYGGAWLDVCNRLIAVLGGGEDPGAPQVGNREVVGKFKTKDETKSSRGKYVAVVVAVLVIAFVAPLLQTYWYVK